jgi:hypothetical protein
MQKIFKFLIIFSLFGQILGSDCQDNFERKRQNRLDQKRLDKKIQFGRLQKEVFLGNIESCGKCGCGSACKESPVKNTRKHNNNNN